jgi:hypothetical protein
MKSHVIVVSVVLSVLVACGSPQQQTAAPPQPGQPSPPYHGTIDQLLGPIALYPDPLLAQVLISAGDPAQVIKLDQWLKNTTQLKGTKLQDAAVKAGFDPSFVVLALFPQVVTNMARDIQWTTRLGQAFTAERTAVFDAIQRLRHQAQNVGTLKDTPQQEVSSRKTSKGEDVIVIEPANPQVVYVPQYNYTTVYTQPPAAVAAPAPAASTTTVIVEEDDDSAEVAIAAGLIGFTAGIAIGAAMDNHYYYGPYGWHGGGYMYNDAWDDYWDHREDAREDWMDHREDIMEERGDYAENRAENRSDLAENRSENRSDVAQNRADNRTQRAEDRGSRAGTAQQQRAEGQTRQQSRPQAQEQRQERATQAQSASGSRAAAPERAGSYEARGYGQGTARTETRTATKSGGADAFSGYSSGRSSQAASARGERSRSSSRGGGGGGRRR